MPNNHKQSNAGNQDQMQREGQSSQNFGNPKHNAGSVQHERHSGQGNSDRQGMPASAGRSQSEMGRSDDDDE